MKSFAIVCAALLMILGSIPSFGAAYSTYTYSIDGEQLESPDAYSPKPDGVYDSKKLGLEVALNAPTAIEVDDDENVYIADPQNSRIIVLNKYYNYLYEISTFINSEGVADSLNKAEGVFIWEGRSVIDGEYVNEKFIYVADTMNSRIVVFDEEGEYYRTIEQPDSDIFESNEIYRPISIAVDSAGRIYVVSSTTYQGIISLTSEGEFTGYIGATKATYNALQLIWRKFQTKEQREASETIVSTEYNNIAIDDEGFVYVTTSAIDESTLSSAIANNNADYAPVKKLNTSGTDIMRRNGFFMPAGEITYKTYVASSSSGSAPTGPSSISDVALGPSGTWSIIDNKRSKIYTYDDNGELLFAFGDTGTQLGNLQSAASIIYQGDKMLILDKQTSSFTVYERTEYGDLLLTAVDHNNKRKYSLALDDWQAILQRNNNFDAAYIGIGKAYFRMGEWTKAMEYFEQAYDTENYSSAFGKWRKEWVEKYIWVIPIVVIVFCVAVFEFFKLVNKVNRKATHSGKKKTFWQEVCYAFHLIFHPFDGFWDLKHEKRGSVRAAFFILGLSVISFAYQSIGRAYIFNPYGGYTDIIGQLTGLLVPIILGATANWCLTTLFDGEGSFKDIFIAICYSLTPIVMFVPITTLLTHIVTNSEAGFINLILSCCYVWIGFLIFFGTMVTHDYSMGKNVITLVGTIVCACVIMFIMVLFSSLLIKMVSFVSSIVTEITYQ